MQSYSLYELNEYIRRVIALNFDEPLWIKAEVSQVNEVRGNVYLELIQHDESSGQVIAQSSAAIWYKSYLFIKKKLGNLLPSLLIAGSDIQVKVMVEFNERYGFKLSILDIDASYTLGRMEMVRQEIIQRLTNEGLQNLNKNVSTSSVLQRIAIISSETAAGYKDFIAQLSGNPYGFQFLTTLYHCAMQGQQVESDVVEALRDIKDTGEYDCIVLIRGGGSRLDLSYFDNYNIAHAIAHSDIPVYSGIGHEIDQSVADMVSHTALKTPTAVADFIIEHNADFEYNMDSLKQALFSAGTDKVQNEKHRLKDSIHLLSILPKNLLHKGIQELNDIQSTILYRKQMVLQSQNTKLNHMKNLLKASDPVNILKKGFAIVSKNENVISNAGMVKTGDEIGVRLKDGTFKARKL